MRPLAGGVSALLPFCCSLQENLARKDLPDSIGHVDFRWNRDNLEHIVKHGVSPAEAEYVVRHAGRPYPSPAGDGKWRVRGQTRFGWYLQVIFVKDAPHTLYVIHARPLTDREKRAFRRQ